MIINFKTHFRNFLNSVSRIRDLVFGHEKLKLDILRLLNKLHEEELSRLNYLRNEILLEFRYSKEDVNKITTRIVNQKKYELMARQNRVVLNIGCGHHSVCDMLNLDMRELPNVDIVADASNIQLTAECAQGIFSSHVLEHFPEEKLRRIVIPNWVKLIRPGGYFRVVVPDAEGMMEAFVHGSYPFENLRTVTFGLQEYQGDIHYTMFSRNSLKLLLEEAGLRDVTYVATSRANGLCLEMEVLAYK